MPEPVSVGVAAGRLLSMTQEIDASDLIYLAIDERRAHHIARFLQAVSPHEALFFPAWDTLPYDRLLPSREVMGSRMNVLHKLTEPADRGRIVLTTPEAILQRVPPHTALRMFDLRVGADLNPDELRNFCESVGYVFDERVDEVGEVAFRGKVIDLFPAGLVSPVRLEIAQMRIDAIRPYDPLSQRTQGEVQSILLGPVLEVSPGSVSLFDYTRQARLVIEPSAVERCEAVLATIAEAYQDAKHSRQAQGESGRLPIHEPRRLYLSAEEWNELLAERAVQCDLANKIRSLPSFFSTSRAGHALLDFLEEQIAAGRRIVLIGGTDQILTRMTRRAEPLVGGVYTSASHWEDVLNPGNSSLLCLKAELDEGFLDEENDVVVLAAPDVLGSGAIGSKPVSPAAAFMQAAAGELHLGDLVIHEDHGLGILRGLEPVDTQAGQEAIRLAYAKDGMLLIPVKDAGKLWRYGSAEGAVALDRLDSDGWNDRKAKIQRELRKAARALHEKAVRRKLDEAPKLVPPKAAYKRFVLRFPYFETPDQSSAIKAVLADLASGRPMDRLIVGDVSFGKTEVALRAAAAVALAGKQVAVVAPTTVLARQHFTTFLRRFAGFGMEVAQLSRLVSRKEAVGVKAALASGKIRIVIGTHALASKSVQFADLGLLVIDEEHRFGTTHKRKLRRLVNAAHVLTLTATPIPRTLQSGLIGLQDLSIIATPPSRRRPIRTFSLPFDLGTVNIALRREKRRGGQSFVIVPRIEDIELAADQLRAIAPDLDINIAHGKLPANQVDATMIAFSEGRGDVLLATSIIESGLDVPAANTMIVLRADLFGLAELHQLRGRVGRGPLQAVCYLMTEAGKELPEATSKRLSTLQAFDRLGAGMDIAAQDLDLRGAGDLLGEEQAGHVKLIGLGLYQELFAQALRQVRGESLRVRSTDIQIEIPASLPESYIADQQIRINLYRRIARASGAEDMEELAEEIADRFGPPPQAVCALLELGSIRALAHSLKISRIVAGPKAIAVSFAPELDIRSVSLQHPGQADETLQWKRRRLVLRNSSDQPAERLALIKELLNSLREIGT